MTTLFVLITSWGIWPLSEAAAQARCALDINSRPLDESLQELARQCDVQILFFAQLTEGLRAPALVGELTLDDAMHRLLGGSGLDFHAVNERTLQVERASPERGGLAALAVTPAGRLAQPDSRMAEVRIVGKAEQLVATRVPTALQEIPQSISIISPAQITAQNDTDLAEALSHSTGVVIRRASSLNEQYYIRSFKVLTIHVDGGAALDTSIPEPFILPSSPDLSEFDHVEVLRGSDALFAGNSNPGGTVSLVRKRPLREFQMDLSGIVGSWDHRQIEADVTGPLAGEGALRGRADVIYARKDYFYSSADFERKQIFGVLEYDVTPRATLTVGGSYQWDDTVPWEGGVPFFDGGQDAHLPRSTGLTFDWAYQRTRTSEAYVQYRQQFADGWNVRFNFASWRPKIDYAYAVMLSLGSTEEEQLTGFPNAIFSGRPTIHRQQTGDITVTGTLDWFGRREDVAFGVDFRHATGQWNNYLVEPGDPQPLRAFDPSVFADPRTLIDDAIGIDGTGTLNQHGAFASVRVHLSDAWSVSTGLRVATDARKNVSWYEFGSQTTEPSTSRFGSRNVVTPYYGLLYKLNDHYAWYASYADIYLSRVSAQSVSGEFIGPGHGVNIETGMKGAWRDGALQGTLALFRIRQRDLAIVDPDHFFDHPEVQFCCYLKADAHSRGAELELTGELSPGWLIGAGYTYSANWGQSAYTYPQVAPRHLARMWTSVQLPGNFSRWTLGGSVTAESRTTVDGAGFQCTSDCDVPVVQKSYGLLDLRAAFQVGRNWEMALNVNNVFDRTYYDSIDPYYGRAFYGSPRNITMRVDGRF